MRNGKEIKGKIKTIILNSLQQNFLPCKKGGKLNSLECVRLKRKKDEALK
jgi:hypothetical protein